MDLLSGKKMCINQRANKPASTSLPIGSLNPSSYLWVSTTGSDTNPGSNSLPKRTISAAVAAATAGTAVMVEPGAYYDNVGFLRSGTESQPIWLESVGGPTATVIAPAHAYIPTVRGYGV